MFKLMSLVLVIAACSEPPRNRAAEFAKFVDPGATCRPIDDNREGRPDTAVCRILGALSFCAAGPDSEPGCKPYGQAPAQQKAPAAPTPPSFAEQPK